MERITIIRVPWEDLVDALNLNDCEVKDVYVRRKGDEFFMHDEALYIKVSSPNAPPTGNGHHILISTLEDFRDDPI